MKIIFSLAAGLLMQVVQAQTTLPLIRATSRSVAIRDGAFLDKQAWSLSPQLRPDVYTADRTRQPKWVVFYTDQDSIRVRVKPGSTFDFVVLLNGKDSCYTRIRSALGTTQKQGRQSKPDTLPFVLTAQNVISMKAILNRQDTLLIHFDLSSFDVRLTREAIEAKTHLLANQPDALSGKAKPNFNRLAPVETIQIGTGIWPNPTLAATPLTARGMDGRFGWNLFEGKIIEIDYTNRRLVVHPTIPHSARQYQQLPLTFIRSFPCLTGRVNTPAGPAEGLFLLDTGAEKAMILDSAWAARHHLPGQLPILNESVLSDPRGVRYTTRTVVVPLVSVGGQHLPDVPATILPRKNPSGFEVNYFGNGFLKRFNLILDFQNDVAYLKPNGLLTAPYLEKL